MTPLELARVQKYMREAFDNSRITLKKQKLEDSAEVYIAEEFVGVLYRDEDEGELSYAFNMAILSEDLPEV
ncbi:MAG: DUF3126 family protein [Sphingomonadales bacterium]|nr:DUF3126 family protein [Sphingomonadales bacterium]